MIYYKCIQNHTGGLNSMKTETKRLIVTIINIAIFVGNAIISFINGGGDVSTAVGVVSGVATTVATVVAIV